MNPIQIKTSIFLYRVDKRKETAWSVDFVRKLQYVKLIKPNAQINIVQVIKRTLKANKRIQKINKKSPKIFLLQIKIVRNLLKSHSK